MATTSTDRRYGVNAGLAFKAPCKAATTANITLSGEQTIDGVALVTNDRCLVKNQTTASENGIYVVDTSAWERALDWDGTRDVKKGTSVRVTDGTVNQGYWYVTTSDPITPGTTSVSFSRTVNSSEIPAVATITALRSINPDGLSDNDTVIVLGDTTAGDGGGGDFYWDASSADADDGEITILPTGYAGTGRWKRSLSISTVTDPTVGQALYAGQFVNITKADGSTDHYQVVANVTWADVITHEYGSTKSIAPIHKGRKNYGACPAPTGHDAAPFTVHYGHDRIQTSVDTDSAFRTAYMPTVAAGDVYYVDGVSGADANSGKSWTLAKATIGSARTAINTAGRTAIVYVRSNGGIYDRNAGLSHTNIINPDYALIGVPDSSGNPCYIGNVYAASEVSFSANATYAYVYETSTATMTQPGRAFDLKTLRTIYDDNGVSHQIPIQYTAKTSLADVAATPGSYWFDSAGTTFYVHMIGALTPAMCTDLVVERSSTHIVPTVTTGQTFYMENVRIIGGIYSNANRHSGYYNNCISLGSSTNGFGWELAIDAGSKDCIAVDAAADGFNYHNTGANITSITQANPPVVTVSAAHGFNNGDSVLIGPTNYGDSIGMTEVLNQTFTVANATALTFELSGIDATGYSAYTGNGKARLPASSFFELNPTAIYTGTSAGSNQATTAHENCHGITINGLFIAPWRDHITDIGEAERWVIGTRLRGTQITTSNPSYLKRFVFAGDAANIALDRVQWGGYRETGVDAIAGNATHSVKVLNTELPDSADYANVSADW